MSDAYRVDLPRLVDGAIWWWVVHVFGKQRLTMRRFRKHNQAQAAADEWNLTAPEWRRVGKKKGQ